MHTTGAHTPCTTLKHVYTRRWVPQASTRHRPTLCRPLISASLLMFSDSIPGQILKILAQNGTATPYSQAVQEEVRAFPLDFPCLEWLSHFLFTEGAVCQAGGVLGKGGIRSLAGKCNENRSSSLRNH